MKELFDDESRKAMVQYRLARASESIEDADMCANNGRYNLAINRLYYACYYAISALLLANKIECNTHKGLKSMFNLHFITTGKIDKIHSQTLSTLFGYRQAGDYDDFIEFNEDDYDNYKPKVSLLVETIKAFL
jgi:uncharacterized protein (UPF0332 family)